MTIFILFSLILSNCILVVLLKKYIKRFRKFQSNDYQGYATAVYIPASKTDLNVYTVANRYNKQLDQLVESTKYHNLNISIVGLSHHWRGLTCKMIWLNQYFDYQKMPDDQLYLFVDAYDTFVCCDQLELIKKFKEFGKDLVFSAEKVCWPDKEKKDFYPESPTVMRYLNSGAYMGYVGAFRQAYHQIQPPYKNRDQRMWTKYYLENQDKVALDYQSRLFLSLTRIDIDNELIKKDERPYYSVTKQSPSIIHANGPCKNQYDQIYAQFYPNYAQSFKLDPRV